MKKLIFLFPLLFLALGTQAQLSKTINLATAGTLSTALTSSELQNINNLTITGTIDARDFRTMRDSMPVLAILDLYSTTIAAYEGTEGSWEYYPFENHKYPANAIPDQAFSRHQEGGKISLKSIILPSLTSSIGYSAFWGCIGINSINIPASVTFIHDTVFDNFAGSIIVDVNNPIYSSIDGVWYNKNQTALLYYPRLKQGHFDIPFSVSSISEAAFLSCTGLTSVTIPSSIKFIGVNVFNSCNRLTKVTIPSSVTVIESQAFQDCSSLTSADVPLYVMSIESNAFSGCSGLTTLTIPSSVTAIRSAAFSGCSGLTTITSLTQTPLSISRNVFDKVDKSTCILKVPIGSKSAYQADSQWGQFTHIVEVPFVSILTNSLTIAGNTTSLVISSSIEWIAKSDQRWLTVTSGGASGKTTLTFNAEENNTGQTRTAIVTVSADGFDDQLITINQYKKVVLTPGGLHDAYKDILRSVSNLTLSGTMDARDFKTLRDSMWQLSRLDLSGVTIASYTGTEGTLDTSNINYTENTIPGYAYSNPSWGGITALTDIVLPTSITSIGRNAFKGCTGLTTISIPSSVTSIGLESFMNCTNLSSFFIPSTVRSIERMAFWGVKEIIVDESSPYFSCTDGILFNKNHTELLQFPKSKSGNYKIPSTVTSILSGAFWNCKLKSVTIPSSVKSIGAGAFESTNVYNLDTVTVWWSAPLEISSLDDIFRDYAWGRHHSTLCVPYGTVSLYAASPWNGFGKIVEMSGLKLSATSATVKPDQVSTATIDISSNVLWTASSDQNWLTVSPTTGNGANTLTFTATENPNHTIRTASVRVSANGVEPQIITVTQDAITGIGTVVKKPDFTFYPNPTYGKVKLVFGDIIPAAACLEVYDVAGNLILKRIIQNKEEWIDLKGNAPGVYLIKTNLKDFKVQKVILR
jgi:hypothetical protein